MANVVNASFVMRRASFICSSSCPIILGLVSSVNVKECRPHTINGFSRRKKRKKQQRAETDGEVSDSTFETKHLDERLTRLNTPEFVLLTSRPHPSPMSSAPPLFFQAIFNVLMIEGVEFFARS
ncbi:hypothetical protein CEXT_413911 [Caerostris extrusa]|uniref:Uncharacterized protein n=1 Tax=Caerostris extrusa TaxID=172846 RepID=A0AAV4TUU0_CAEEX|nr:hypothetical protein CEXT_413911 [Caerostris extrusa]